MFDPVVPASQQAFYDRFHFSPGVKVGDLLLCSGQIGIGADGKCPADPTEQFRLAFDGVAAILEEAGGSWANVVEMTTFHVDLSKHLGAFTAVKDEYLSEPWSAWTAIGCTELAMPGGLAEIRVQAKL